VKKKHLFLFLALVLPVAIFFFLKGFGRNRFDLPVIHEAEGEWPNDCQSPSAYPFVVADSVMDPVGRPVVILFRLPGQESLLRLPVEIDTTKVGIRWMNYTVSGGSPCLFGAAQAAGAVLIDGDNRVRGIYEELDRDETDRLIMETKILTGNY